MKTAIIVYSETGHTLSVAEKLKEKIVSTGHEATLFRLGSNAERTIVTNVPDIADFDKLVLAMPVQGFMPAAPMSMFVRQAELLKGKSVSVFVTHFFRPDCFGGRQAIQQLTAAIVAKGGNVQETGIISWRNRNREARIADVLDRFSK